MIDLCPNFGLCCLDVVCARPSIEDTSVTMQSRSRLVRVVRCDEDARSWQRVLWVEDHGSRDGVFDGVRAAMGTLAILCRPRRLPLELLAGLLDGPIERAGADLQPLRILLPNAVVGLWRGHRETSHGLFEGLGVAVGVAVARVVALFSEKALSAALAL